MTSSLTPTQLPAGILRALRKATDIAINFNPTDIVLIPQKKVKKIGGGVDWEQLPPRSSQRFLIEPIGSTLEGITSTGGNQASSNSGASANVWYYKLTGKFDSEMDLYDSWNDGDTGYGITVIQPFNGYERTAIIQAYGKDPNYGS